MRLKAFEMAEAFLSFLEKPNISPVSNNVGKWGQLPGDIIGKLKMLLKHSRRLEFDGPSLRCLNKHWYNEWNRTYFVMLQYWNKSFIREIIPCLSKFSNLTGLGINDFQPRNCHDLIRVVDVLSQLPSLSKLELAGSTVCRNETGRYRRVWNPHGDELVILHSLQDCRQCSLNLKELSQLKQLKLRWLTIVGSAMLNRWTNLKNLTIDSCCILRSCELFDSMKMLRKLCLSNVRDLVGIYDCFPLDDALFPELRVLVIDTVLVKCPFPKDWKMQNLETLCISGHFSHFCGRTGMGRRWIYKLSSLRRLGVKFWHYVDADIEALKPELLPELDIIWMDLLFQKYQHKVEVIQSLRDTECKNVKLCDFNALVFHIMNEG